MTTQLQIDWNINGYNMGAGEVIIDPTADPTGVVINCASYFLQAGGGNPLRVRALQITLQNSSGIPVENASVIVTIGTRNIFVSGVTQINVPDEVNSISIPYAKGAPQLVCMVYSEAIYSDTAIQGSQVGVSNEPNVAVEYQTQIDNVGGVWTWDAVGTAPFNSGPVTTPILLRNSNAFRQSAFMFFGGIVPGLDPTLPGGLYYDSRLLHFPMYWGLDPSTCNVPFWEMPCAPVNTSQEPPLWYNPAGNQQPPNPLDDPTGHAFCIERMPMNPQTSIGEAPIFDGYPRIPEIFPKGPIYVCCMPRLPASGTTSYTMNFGVYIA